VGIMYRQSAGSVPGIPNFQALVSLSPTCHDTLSIGCESAAPYRSAVTRKYLQTVLRIEAARACMKQNCQYAQKDAIRLSLRFACMHAPVVAFHIQTVKSSLPATRMLPFGCQSSHSIPSDGPSKDCTHAPFSELHILTWPATQPCTMMFCSFGPIH